MKIEVFSGVGPFMKYTRGVGVGVGVLALMLIGIASNPSALLLDDDNSPYFVAPLKILKVERKAFPVLLLY